MRMKAVSQDRCSTSAWFGLHRGPQTMIVIDGPP